MKSLVIVTAGLLALSVPAMAQTTPSTNATTQGTETTSGNGQGMPTAATPAGQLSTTGGAVPVAPPAVSSMSVRPNGAVPQALAPTADSSTTGVTTPPK